MNSERATLHTLAGYPDFYLQAESVLFVEVNNASKTIITVAEFRALLNDLEARRLVIGERIHDVMKWKITGAGRAWLKE